MSISILQKGFLFVKKHEETLLLGGFVFLLALVSFAAGYLAALERASATLFIQESGVYGE
ncbi:hypothetical protein KKI17_03395 [Patescibacteria group bacterium]|nr:hypothetical protein [Patescibacteria group bacterium]